MIPKIIHLCWLSGDPYPFEIQKCIDSWKQHLSDYEIWLWDTKRFDVNSTTWTQQAFEKKKYAFAADFIRLYALYNYGGIYLDSDILVYKSFNDLLNLPYFIGCDQINAFEAAVIGAEKNCKWIKDILDSFKKQNFIKDDGTLDVLPLPCRFHHVLVDQGYTFQKLHHIQRYPIEKKHLYVFDKDFFNSRNAVKVKQTPKSFCAHNYAGSWQSKKGQEWLKGIIPDWILGMIYTIGQKTWARNKYSWFQIPFKK